MQSYLLFSLSRSMDALKTFKLKDGSTLKIYQDDSGPDPRGDDNVGKLCIREHRRYNFPNELDYDWDSAGEDAEKLYEQYWIFELDCYEHSGIVFSLAGQGMQCRFDTSKNCGFIAIPKGEDKLTGAVHNTEEEAMRIAKIELKQYNAYLNGEMYGYNITEENEFNIIEENLTKGTRSEYKTTREIDVDSCRGYYEVEDILNEFKCLDPKEID